MLNSLNNMEEMLLANNKKQTISDVASFGMDKPADFVKILNKTVAKEKNADSELSSKTNTLGEIKLSAEESENNWVEFKEVLKKITDEANVESSLDMTLAKDINEIISQLKEAIQDASDIIETNSEEENAEVSTEVLENVSEEAVLVLPKTECVEALKDAVDTKQILASVEKFAETENKSVLENEEILNLKDYSNFSKTELVEFSEEIVDDVISVKTLKDLKNTGMVEEGLSEELDKLLDEDLLKELKIESVQSDTESFSQMDFMNQQTPEEYAVKAMINDSVEAFELKLEASSNVQNVQQVQVKTTEINPSRIIEQITKHLEGLQNNSKVNIVLNPESLGKVNIQLLSSKDGLTAQFTVTTQEAKDLLMKGLDGLKDSLLSHGVTVDNVSVRVTDAQKSEYDADWTEREGSKGGNKEQRQSGKDEKEKNLFEEMMAQTMENENGNV